MYHDLSFIILMLNEYDRNVRDVWYEYDFDKHIRYFKHCEYYKTILVLSPNGTIPLFTLTYNVVAQTTGAITD